MPSRLEIAQKPDLIDAEGEGIRQKARDYFDIETAAIRSVDILTIDADLSRDQGLIQIIRQLEKRRVTSL